MPIRPFVMLGMGGVLNQFDETDDVGAFYFLFGGGASFPLFGSFRGQLQLGSQLYSWSTDEVALNTLVNFPSVTLGITWRYDVPADALEPAESSTEAAGSR